MLSGVLSGVLSLPALAINDQDSCLSESKTLIDFIQCVGSVAEYTRESDRYSKRLRELAKTSGINRANQAGETPLMLAAAAGLSELVSELLKLGAQLELVNAQGETALMMAVKGLSSVDETRPETLALLLKHGASVNVKDKQGRTPLMLATQAAPNFKAQTVALILKSKPAVWTLDQQGEHVLFYLVRAYHPSMQGEDWIWDAFEQTAKLLLAHKPDLKLRNRSGQTVEKLARQQGFLQMAELLKP